ncbi:MAG: EexN family lipoprotein [Burkholderiales bacterium]|nr:EexN family lipoprotein [Burkholderiales bacterium]
MKQFPSLILAAVAAMLLVACGKPALIESVESLVANPERLKELRAQCKADHAKVGDEQCNAVAEATRRRFFGSGGPKHTPAAPAEPALAASAPAPKD